MEWLILFIVSWILFFLLIDWKRLKRSVWGGVIAVALQFLVDTQAMTHGLYEIHKNAFYFFRSSGFFVFGPVLVVGILLVQYHPKSKRMNILNVLALAALYSAQELLLVLRQNVVYTNWHYIDSLQVNLGVMIILSWFTMVMLDDKKGQLQ